MSFEFDTKTAQIAHSDRLRRISFARMRTSTKAVALHSPTPAMNAGSIEPSSSVEIALKRSAGSATLPGTAFAPTAYCSVYWLTARGAPDTDAANTSLHARGEWRRDGETGTVAIDTNFARAMIDDLPPIDAEVHSAHGVVTRSVGSLFDGIDFETDNEYAVGWGAIKNLTNQATFRWK